MADSAAVTHSAGLRAHSCDSPSTCSVCALCGALENLSLCSGCKEAWYCSKDHQLSHWRDHKPACKHEGKKRRPRSKAAAVAAESATAPAESETCGTVGQQTVTLHVAPHCVEGGAQAAGCGDEALLSDNQAAASQSTCTDTDGTCPHAACHVDVLPVQQKCNAVLYHEQSSSETAEGGDSCGSSLTSSAQSDLYNTPDGKAAANLCKVSEAEGEEEQLVTCQTSCDHGLKGDESSMTPNKNLHSSAVSASQWQHCTLGLTNTYRPSCHYSTGSPILTYPQQDQRGKQSSGSADTASASGDFTKFTGSLCSSSGGPNVSQSVTTPREEKVDTVEKTNDKVKGEEENKHNVVEPASTAAHHVDKAADLTLAKSKSAGGKKRFVQPVKSGESEEEPTVDAMRYLDPRSHQAHAMPQNSAPSQAKPSQAETKLVDYVVRSLNNYGLCVVDNFMGEERSIQILQEVLNLYQLEDVFQDGQLVHSMGTTQRIRGDKIAWVDGTEPECAVIETLIQRLDKLLLASKGRFQNKDVSGRTKAMVACYPGQGSGYKRHVDNPNGDGRCITAIYYLNRNWDIKTHGGLLRIFPQQFQQVADIEPKLDRLLFFWSDRRNPHEVHPSFRTRFAITVWYFDSKERNDALKRRKLHASKLEDV